MITGTLLFVGGLIIGANFGSDDAWTVFGVALVVIALFL